MVHNSLLKSSRTSANRMEFSTSESLSTIPCQTDWQKEPYRCSNREWRKPALGLWVTKWLNCYSITGQHHTQQAFFIWNVDRKDTTLKTRLTQTRCATEWFKKYSKQKLHHDKHCKSRNFSQGECRSRIMDNARDGSLEAWKDSEPEGTSDIWDGTGQWQKLSVTSRPSKQKSTEEQSVLPQDASGGRVADWWGHWQWLRTSR